jgi:hypothetical protein
LLFGAGKVLFADVLPFGRRVFAETSQLAAKNSEMVFLRVLSAALAAPVWNTKPI